MLFTEGRRLPIRVEILQRPRDDEIHFRLSGLLTFAEDDVANGQEEHGHGEVADTAHDLVLFVQVHVKEGVPREDPRVDLVVHLDLERLGDDVQQLHRVGGEVPGDGMLGIAADPLHQVFRDIVLLQVLLEDRHLAGPAATDDVLLREARGKGAHHNHASHEGDDEDHDGEEPLRGTHRMHLVHASGELGQAPVQAHQVLRVNTCGIVARLRSPSCPVGVESGHAPPTAGRDVRDGCDEDHQLKELHDEPNLVGLDPLGDARDDLLHTHKPQQPHHAHDAGDARQPAQPHAARREDQP
mmetsp:Transcript_108767/g.306505  ORF Transcript_108767/g.306505 Transcript_108767/m.306505 type:complete len:298 (+) Transcript_108767:426-1319(+)